MNEDSLDTAHLEGLCAAALNALPRTVVVSDTDTILFANAAAARVWGAAKAEDLIGMPVNEILHPDSRAAAAQRRELLANSREDLRGLPTKLLRLDGSPMTIVADARVINLAEGPAFVFLNELTVPAEQAS